MGWIVLALVLVGLAALPVWLNSRLIPMTRDSRDAWPGRTVKLSQGTTRYRWIGGVRGPVIVAVHGLTTPSEVWDPVAERLTEIGYRILVYDLYGRGGSDDVSGPQDTAFHVRQLKDLVKALNLDDELILLGYSMGGQIAAAFAADAPDRVQRLVLVAPSGIRMEESRFDRFCRQTPVIGDWAYLVFGRRTLARLAGRSALDGGHSATIAEVQHKQLARRGYLEAVLSSRRASLGEPTPEIYRGLGRTGLPVLAVWGEADTVIPISAMGQLVQWIRTSRQETLKSAGHGLLYSDADDVAGLVKSMLLEAR